jgi:hypothetical protein
MAVSNLLLALAALAGAVVGQSANATAMPTGELGIEVIQANFQQAGIVGSNNLLPAFAPTALLNVSYPSVGACVLDRSCRYVLLMSAQDHPRPVAHHRP